MFNTVPYETIPDKWLLVGRCVRNTTLLEPSGVRIPWKTPEYFVTFKLPWKRRLYAINLDEELLTNPRFIFRFKWGWTA
jgi:hypothetical protein